MPVSLPKYEMDIVGRGREIGELATLLHEKRLVTVVGPGGIGKTRLSTEAATRATPPGIEAGFVDFSSISDASLVCATVARTLGVQLDPQRDAVEALAAALRTRRFLIVLDNCEHLRGACAQAAAALLEGCPEIRILATGREPLFIEDEHVYRLGPLDDAESLALFLAHARQVDQSFSASEKDLAVIQDICARLDGVPLAVQIVAANVPAMSLTRLRARLEGHLRLLASGNHPILRPQHQTLEALIDWSYDALGDDERVVFRRLGVMNSTFSREAGVAVARFHRISPSEIPVIIETLVEKSILIRNGVSRYRMLAPIRQYALERLRAVGDEHDVRKAFAIHYAERAEAHAATFGEKPPDEWVTALGGDLDNYRAALAWATQFDQPLAARLVASLAEYWAHDGLASEGLRRSEMVLARMRRPDPPEAIPVLRAVARLAMATHTHWRTLEVAERLKIVAEKCGDLDALAQALHLCGFAREVQRLDPQRAVAELREAVALTRGLDQPWRLARVLSEYALIMMDYGGDEAEGNALLHEGLEIAKSLGWLNLRQQIEVNLAEREFRTGRIDEAIERAQAMQELLRPTRMVTQRGHVLINLAAYLSFQGRCDEAESVAHEGITIMQEHELGSMVAWSVQALALVHAQRGALERAARLLGYVDAYCEKFAAVREWTERIIRDRLEALLRDAFDDAVLEQLVTSGRELSEEEAVFDAIGNSGTPETV
jgi:predicted ATPase